VASNFLAVLIGVTMGSLAGYLGGAAEVLIMRFIDVLMGFPVLLLAVGLIAVLDPNPFTIILVIAFVNWTYLSRIVYNMVRALKTREFVVAALSIGVPAWRILLRHILPHLVSIMVVYASLGIASSVMLESTLSYVGIGVQPPTASWGNMINQGQRYYRTAPWLVLFPGALIALSVLAFNLLGDGLRDAVDPYARGRRT
jgi:peptide/nickel transport system permease protein